MTIIDKVIIIFHYLICLGIGVFLFLKRKRTTEEEYFLASRSLNSIHTVSTYLSTFTGSTLAVSTATLGFMYGFSVMWCVPAIFLALILLIPLIPKIKEFADKFKLFTLSDFLYHRYGRKVAVLSGILIFFTFATLVSFNLTIGGIFLSSIFSLSLHKAIIFVSIIIITYTLLGGFRAVVWTDIIQLCFIGLGIFLLLFLSFPGISKLQTLPSSFFDPTGWGFSNIVGMFILLSLTFIGAQDAWQRVYAAKDIRTAKKSTLIAAIILAIIVASSILIGIFGKALLPDINPQFVIPNLSMKVLPPVFLGLVLMGYLAIFTSSADSFLNIAGMCLLKDVFQKSINPKIKGETLLKLDKPAVLLAGMVALGISLLSEDILQILYNFLTWLVLLIPAILAGFYWKKANTNAAFLSIAGGWAGALLCNFLWSASNAVFVGLGLSIAIMVIGSFLKFKETN